MPRLLISLAGVSAALLLGELAMALYAPLPDPYARFKTRAHEWIRNERPVNYRVRTHAEPGLPGVTAPATYSTNNMGFRGDHLALPKPPRELRIFMVGGSTTECFYLDDAQAIHAVVQDVLTRRGPKTVEARVYNAGRGGHRSDDHVAMITQRIVHLAPDVIVVFAGINDLVAAMNGFDSLHYGRSEMTFSSSFLLRMLATELQVPRAIHHAVRWTYPRTEQRILLEVPLRSDYLEKIRLQRAAARVTDAVPRVDVAAYQQNLRTIAGIARAHRIQAVFMTQQTTWNSDVDPRAKEWHWTRYQRGVVWREDQMDRALEALNDGMRRVAREHAVPLFDLRTVAPKSLEMFYDDVHFNVRGAQESGTALARFLIDAGLVRGR